MKVRLFAAGLFLAFPLSVVSPPALAPLLALLGIASLFAKSDFAALSRHAAARLLAALLAWAIFSSLWSLNREVSLLSSLALTAECALGCAFITVMMRAREEIYAKAVMCGLMAGMALLATEIISGGWLNASLRRNFFSQPDYVFLPEELNRPACLLALFVWPLVGAYRRMGALLWLAALGLLAALDSLSALLGFAAGSTAFALALLNGARLAKLLAAGIMLALILFPAMIHFTAPERIAEQFPDLPKSAQHRLLIWKFSVDKFMENKWTGTGFNTARHVPGAADMIPPGIVDGGQYIPSHPHSHIIQVLLELGITGALLWLSMIAALLRAICRVSAPAPRAAALGMAASYLAAGMTGFGVWQYWWVAAVFLSSGFWFLASDRRTRGREREIRR